MPPASTLRTAPPQNRVPPAGETAAAAARGTLKGNRGVPHDGPTPGTGQRPCAPCRRDAFRRHVADLTALPDGICILLDGRPRLSPGHRLPPLAPARGGARAPLTPCRLCHQADTRPHGRRACRALQSGPASDGERMTHETFPGAPQSLIDRWEARRGALAFGPGEALPAADMDLGPYDAPLTALPPPTGRHGQKLHEIAPEFIGAPALHLLHAVTIAHLRKRRFPPHAPALFRHLWTARRDALLAGLPARWLISAAITFADHGATEGERRLGAELNILFSLLKLTEFERLFSGRAPTEAFRPGRRADAPLPLGMEPFSLVSGGLDVNLLAPLWARALEEPVLGPLAEALLHRLNADPGTIFARLAAMRAMKARKRPET